MTGATGATGATGSSSDDFDARYRSARAGAVIFDRSDRARLIVGGKAPGQMLGGILTGRIPGPLKSSGGPAGARSYSAILTPKGKMVSDLFVYRMPGEEETYLLDLPTAGAEAVREHFRKVLPPRLAKVGDASESHRTLSVAGPESAETTAELVGADVAALDGLQPDDVAVAQGALIARSGELAVPTLDLIIPSARWGEIGEALERSELPRGGHDVWDTLRIEAGTPAFGVDMTEDTIPIEAGIEARAIDHTKGCYTGQEVIVRILHRGHVNRHLRKLVVEGDADEVARGDELLREGSDKPVGWITSVAWSPAAGRFVALGYVRREVEPGAYVRVSVADGPTAQVLERGAALGAPH